DVTFSLLGANTKSYAAFITNFRKDVASEKK
nr:RecName: Full=Ribosome-inactivating protein momorcochin-S; AltName: Full=rRNA N-glycosidase [Momordica cochinchinensis]